MADRIAVLQDGHIRQLATPLEIYRNPNSPFMAQFVGEANLLPVLDYASVPSAENLTDTASTYLKREASPGLETVRTSIGLLRTSHHLVRAGHVLIRPEDVRITSPGAGIDAVIVSSFYYGATLQVELDVAGTPLHASPAGTLASQLHAGDNVGVVIDPSDVILIPRDS